MNRGRRGLFGGLGMMRPFKMKSSARGQVTEEGESVCGLEVGVIRLNVVLRL